MKFLRGVITFLSVSKSLLRNQIRHRTVSTSNLSVHLHSKHKIDASNSSPKTAHEAQSSLTKFFGSSNSVSLSQLARDIFLWFADGFIPFSLIESDGTKLFLAKYCKISPDQIPGRDAWPYQEQVGKCTETRNLCCRGLLPLTITWLVPPVLIFGPANIRNVASWD